MKTLATDFISLIAFLIPIFLIIIYIPANHFLKKMMKTLLIKSLGKKNIRFTHRSPCLLKVWLLKNPAGRWSLITRYFFIYDHEGTLMSGQAIISNRTLIDIKYYPPGFQDPKAKLPILAANDEFATGFSQTR